MTLDVSLDLGTAFGLPGGTVFLQYLSVNPEGGGSADAGDIQVFSNIESDRHLDVIYELWYEQLLLDDRLRLKVGKVDANSEFAFVDAAGDFSNSSAGFSPTILAFPSYPDPAMSVNVFVSLVETEAWRLGAGYGVYDGALNDGVPTGGQGPASFFSGDRSSDLFHVWQGELSWSDARAAARWFNAGRVSAGAWHHTGSFDRFDGGTESGTSGGFLTFETRVFDPLRAPSGAATGGGPSTGASASERGVYAFAQLGFSDDAVSEIAHHVAGGVVWRGPVAARPDDALGVYLSFVDLSDEPAAGFSRDEFVVDAYYRVQVSPAVFVQAELQFIAHPSGDPDVDHAMVGGVRFGVSF